MSLHRHPFAAPDSHSSVLPDVDRIGCIVFPSEISTWYACLVRLQLPISLVPGRQSPICNVEALFPTAALVCVNHTVVYYGSAFDSISALWYQSDG
jgi:1-acyl-sn-glycerol-3-phosphate acyltransferase